MGEEEKFEFEEIAAGLEAEQFEQNMTQLVDTIGAAQHLAAHTYKEARMMGIPRRLARKMSEDVWESFYYGSISVVGG